MLAEVIVEFLLLIVRAILYAIGEALFQLFFGSIGAGVRWFFLNLFGKPRTIKELKRKRTKEQKLALKRLRRKNASQEEERFGCLDQFIGLLVVLGVILAIVYFYK